MFTTLLSPRWLARAKKRSLLLTSTLFLLFLYSLDGSAQMPNKAPTASISGRVTIEGKGAAGITVTVTTSSSGLEKRTVAKTTTDGDGKYQLTGLAAGQFTIMPVAKAFVVLTGDEYKEPGQSITVADGETIEKIDFALIRGGVITGRITDTDGHPVIGERVNVMAEDLRDTGGAISIFDGPRNKTDDRGIYRVYGLRPGNYKVSIGQTADAGNVAIMGMGGSQYPKTFYPGVAEEAKATSLEISDGTEVSNIDIVARRTGRGFSVFGRVVDADSGEPVPNVHVVHASLDEGTQQLGGLNFTGSQTDANGKFRLDNIQPGHYAAYMLGIGDGNLYSDQKPFDVSDGDVSGVEIKVHRGATISGVAVIEDNFDPAGASLLQAVSIFAFSTTKGGVPSFSRGQINGDGRFSFSGLAPGKVRINMAGYPTPPKGLTLLRTEVDGIEQEEGIEVNAGSQIAGVRLIFAYGTGSIRGEVKAGEGMLPVGVTLQITIRSMTGGARQFSGVVDERGRFVLENIPPGTYEISVGTFLSARSASKYASVPRTVNVENGPVQVVLVVNFAAEKEPE